MIHSLFLHSNIQLVWEFYIDLQLDMVKKLVNYIFLITQTTFYYGTGSRTFAMMTYNNLT